MYRRSPALADWLGARKRNIEELVRAHGLVGNTGPGTGPGRPPKAGTEQINEALVVRLCTEFQGAIRDLHDQMAVKIVRASGCDVRYQATLITASTRSRAIDRGNPRLGAIIDDFKRFGIQDVSTKMASTNPRHADDRRRLERLVELRNSITHDDQDGLATLRHEGVRASRGYADSTRVRLGRLVRALDKVVWDHLATLFPGSDPWSP